MVSQDLLLSTLWEWTEIFMHRSMQGIIQYSREKGLSMSMIGTLGHLNHTGQAGVSGLGQHLGVSSAAASQMLDRLVEEGLIERTEDPDDRRMKRITLTEEGCQIFQESATARTRWLEELVLNLTEGEKETVRQAMRLMIDKLRQVDESAGPAT